MPWSMRLACRSGEGQAHDGRSAADMFDGLGKGDVLLGDRAYDSDAMRATLAARGAWACVKPMPNRKRIPAFSLFLYRYRNLVERFFSKCGFRGHRAQHSDLMARGVPRIVRAAFRDDRAQLRVV